MVNTHVSQMSVDDDDLDQDSRSVMTSMILHCIAYGN
jgi:hypothetical protein